MGPMYQKGDTCPNHHSNFNDGNPLSTPLYRYLGPFRAFEVPDFRTFRGTQRQAYASTRTPNPEPCTHSGGPKVPLIYTILLDYTILMGPSFAIFPILRAGDVHHNLRLH